jgi:hypothetical protein
LGNSSGDETNSSVIETHEHTAEFKER